MNYDCIIIGGGIAGLTCGIKCLKDGLRCAIISAGMSALHFSSGSVDVFSYDEQSQPIGDPFVYIENFTASHPDHPYTKCGPDTVRDALFFFKDILAHEGLELHHNGNKNHFIISTLGALKPSFFSQGSVYSKNIRAAFEKKSKIAVLNFDGYRDFYPDITIANLKKNALFKDTDFISGNILFPDYGSIKKNPFEFRSVDIARIFDTSRYLEDIAKQIKNKAAYADIVCFPAFIGISNFKKHHETLQELTGKLIYEIPTLPPSLPGMRIDNALKSSFASMGGVFIAGDRVISGVIKNGMLENVRTANNMNEVLKAHCYVLASGSFFSGGMTSDSASIREPVFSLKVEYSPSRGDWASDKLFDKNSHKFIEYGVETNDSMNPFGADGSSISNLFCAGAILSHYNPVKHACGSGVAISTGYCAAKNIINRIKKVKGL